MSSQITVALPYQMLIETFKYLNDDRDVANLNLVCKYFKKINQSSDLAKYRVLKLYLSLKLNFCEPVSYAEYVELAKISFNERVNIDFLKKIQHVFSSVPLLHCSTPSQETINQILSTLKTSKWLRTDTKLEGFRYIQTAINSCEKLAIAYYDSLPLEVQQRFKTLMWQANGCSTFYSGVDHEDYFCGYVIETDIRGMLVHRATNAYLKLLRKNL